MKISFSTNKDTNESSLVATPGELDGFPAIPKLHIGKSITNLSADRLAVASVLAFRRYISGQIVFDEKISALTAEAISKVLFPRWSHCSPLHPANLPIPRGSRTVNLSGLPVIERSRSTLAIVGSDDFSGTTISDQLSIIPSNAWSIDRIDQHISIDQVCGRLSAAVLLAEDLDIAILRLDRNEFSTFEDYGAYEELLGAVGMGLEFYA